MGSGPIDPLPRDAGITLIELLVTVAVLAVLAVGATLSIRPGDDRGPADMARFVALYEQTRSLAVHGRSQRGMVVDDSRFVRLARRSGGVWDISDQRIRWRGRARFRIETPGQAFSAPGLVFLPNGTTSAFEVNFQGRSGRSGRCQSDGLTGVTCRGI